MGNKKPRFFCDNCGYEVGSEVKACPYCGRYFASVRCPACDYSGPDGAFRHGCPLCGYSAPPDSKYVDINLPYKKKRKEHETLPAWTYIVAGIALIVAVFLLSWAITK